MSINIRRGRNRQLDQFNAGTAQVVFNNNSRILDPLNTASIYYPFVLPRSPIIIYANGTPIYTGFVEDWNLDYQNANQGRMVASALTPSERLPISNSTPSPLPHRPQGCA
jgi:hypothetical protein